MAECRTSPHGTACCTAAGAFSRCPCCDPGCTWGYIYIYIYMYICIYITTRDPSRNWPKTLDLQMSIAVRAPSWNLPGDRNEAQNKRRAYGWSLHYWRRGRVRDTLNVPARAGRVRSKSGPRRKTWPGTFRAGPPEFNLELHWGVAKVTCELLEPEINHRNVKIVSI